VWSACFDGEESNMSRKTYNPIESILGYDISTRKLIGESWEDELLDAYRELISTAKKSSSFEELIDAVVEFLDALEDGDEEGSGKVQAAFGNILRNQIMSDEIRDQVSALVHESIRKPYIDGRFICESLEGIEAMQDKMYKNVKLSRSFDEASKNVQEFCDRLKALNPEMGHDIEETMVQGILETMVTPEFKKKIRALAKAEADASADEGTQDPEIK
jgi:hypothetical protein